MVDFLASALWKGKKKPGGDLGREDRPREASFEALNSSLARRDIHPARARLPRKSEATWPRSELKRLHLKRHTTEVRPAAGVGGWVGSGDRGERRTRYLSQRIGDGEVGDGGKREKSTPYGSRWVQGRGFSAPAAFSRSEEVEAVEATFESAGLLGGVGVAPSGWIAQATKS